MVLGLAPAALAGHGAGPTSKDMRHLANGGTSGTTNSDLAFWQKLAFAGDHKGFRIFDIASRSKPKSLASMRCNGSQGATSASNATACSSSSPSTGARPAATARGGR